MPVSSCLYVGHLPSNVEEKDLEEEFRKFGKVKEVCLLRDPVTGSSRCFAYITYFNIDSCQVAIEAMNKKSWKGKLIKVEISNTTRIPGRRPSRDVSELPPRYSSRDRDPYYSESRRPVSPRGREDYDSESPMRFRDSHRGHHPSPYERDTRSRHSTIREPFDRAPFPIRDRDSRFPPDVPPPPVYRYPDEFRRGDRNFDREIGYSSREGAQFPPSRVDRSVPRDSFTKPPPDPQFPHEPDHRALDSRQSSPRRNYRPEHSGIQDHSRRPHSNNQFPDSFRSQNHINDPRHMRGTPPDMPPRYNISNPDVDSSRVNFYDSNREQSHKYDSHFDESRPNERYNHKYHQPTSGTRVTSQLSSRYCANEYPKNYPRDANFSQSVPPPIGPYTHINHPPSESRSKNQYNISEEVVGKDATELNDFYRVSLPLREPSVNHPQGSSFTTNSQPVHPHDGSMQNVIPPSTRDSSQHIHNFESEASNSIQTDVPEQAGGNSQQNQGGTGGDWYRSISEALSKINTFNNQSNPHQDIATNYQTRNSPSSVESGRNFQSTVWEYSSEMDKNMEDSKKKNDYSTSNQLDSMQANVSRNTVNNVPIDSGDSVLFNRQKSQSYSKHINNETAQSNMDPRQNHPSSANGQPYPSSFGSLTDYQSNHDMSNPQYPRERFDSNSQRYYSPGYIASPHENAEPNQYQPIPPPPVVDYHRSAYNTNPQDYRSAHHHESYRGNEPQKRTYPR